MNCKYCGNKLTNGTYCVRCGRENDEKKKEEQINISFGYYFLQLILFCLIVVILFLTSFM